MSNMTDAETAAYARYRDLVVELDNVLKEKQRLSDEQNERQTQYGAAMHALHERHEKLGEACAEARVAWIRAVKGE